jgi:hypothetical protein
MTSKPVKAILYHDIKEKKILERKIFKPLPPVESMIHTLDMMDLYSAMRKRPHSPEDEMYPWIVLKFRK